MKKNGEDAAAYLLMSQFGADPARVRYAEILRGNVTLDQAKQFIREGVNPLWVLRGAARNGDDDLFDFALSFFDSFL